MSLRLSSQCHVADSPTAAARAEGSLLADPGMPMMPGGSRSGRRTRGVSGGIRLKRLRRTAEPRGPVPGVHRRQPERRIGVESPISGPIEGDGGQKCGVIG